MRAVAGESRRLWQQTIWSGATKLKNMIKRRELSRLVILYTCLCHVTAVSSCGDHQLRKYQAVINKISEKYQVTALATVLGMLKETNPDVYKILNSEWQRYTNCVGLVDTGYFKRSGFSRSKDEVTAEDSSELAEGNTPKELGSLSSLYQILTRLDDSQPSSNTISNL
ncbi:uncharacterized protein LOC131936598 [Physella acuta]|uniref:uncharacterized protein LOC131936598 n=1 Tax=Physella acuta TaxID=109671 RepID=UPI0027DE8B1F|nr:uncharacterized protein LOC131936598 [Physella acuta]